MIKYLQIKAQIMPTSSSFPALQLIDAIVIAKAIVSRRTGIADGRDPGGPKGGSLN